MPTNTEQLLKDYRDVEAALYDAVGKIARLQSALDEAVKQRNTYKRRLESNNIAPDVFEINYSMSCVLDSYDLWPDGDGPENPSPEDVAELIDKSGGILEVIRKWNLDEESPFEVTRKQ